MAAPVSFALKRQILEHEKVTVMLSSCFSKFNHACLENNSSETNVVFADFDVLFFNDSDRKKERKFLENKLIRNLPLENAFPVSEKIFHSIVHLFFG